MDLQASGTRALVSGSSSGIGAATARILSPEGAAGHGSRGAMRRGPCPWQRKGKISAAAVSANAAVGDLATGRGGKEGCDASNPTSTGQDTFLATRGAGAAVRNPVGGDGGRPVFLDFCPIEDWTAPTTQCRRRLALIVDSPRG